MTIVCLHLQILNTLRRSKPSVSLSRILLSTPSLQSPALVLQFRVYVLHETRDSGLPTYGLALPMRDRRALRSTAP